MECKYAEQVTRNGVNRLSIVWIIPGSGEKATPFFKIDAGARETSQS
jgi:hypothetical protein